MNETELNAFAAGMDRVVAHAAYPSTPDLWPALRSEMARRSSPSRLISRRWAPALAAVALALGLVLLASPSARAAVFRVIQLGAIRIFVEPGTTTPTSTDRPLITPSPSPVPELRAPLDLQGATSVEAVREAMGDAFRLPTYPSDLGSPDLAFLQSPGGTIGILVWLDPEDPTRAELALFILGSGAFGGKSNMRLILETEVDGRPALWLIGPHSLLLHSGQTALRTLVSGNVLVWQEGDTTYRLETRLAGGSRTDCGIDAG
jgi:hypothetical protein